MTNFIAAKRIWSSFTPIKSLKDWNPIFDVVDVFDSLSECYFYRTLKFSGGWCKLTWWYRIELNHSQNFQCFSCVNFAFFPQSCGHEDLGKLTGLTGFVLEYWFSCISCEIMCCKYKVTWRCVFVPESRNFENLTKISKTLLKLTKKCKFSSVITLDSEKCFCLKIDFWGGISSVKVNVELFPFRENWMNEKGAKIACQVR